LGKTKNKPLSSQNETAKSSTPIPKPSNGDNEDSKVFYFFLSIQFSIKVRRTFKPTGLKSHFFGEGGGN